MKADFSKYLSRYGSDFTYEIETDINSCRYAVVVPAIAEYENIRCFMDSFLQIDKTYFKDTLLLFVINHHQNSPAEVRENNLRTIDFLRTNNNPADLHTGILDAASAGKEFPEKDAGVGLARKTGMDAVLPYFRENSKNIIICTDADCTFDKNYLTETVDSFVKQDADAAVISFRHRFDNPETAEAVTCYEIFLRYYVLGLKYASSPFAFHTIGSAMACTPEAYVNIEGMNKRKAAEDFYFLEKLAKKYRIEKITNTSVYPSSRRSWRVPFGTGQRMNRHLANERDEYMLVDPSAFKVLSEWNKLFLNNDIFEGSYYLNLAGKISPALYKFLSQQGFEKDWQSILNNTKNRNGILKKKVQWFDGFRTLKLVHYLRDNEAGLIPMSDALDKFFLMSGINFSVNSGTHGVHQAYLELLRRIDN